jgi:hypothetical protein
MGRRDGSRVAVLAIAAHIASAEIGCIRNRSFRSAAIVAVRQASMSFELSDASLHELSVLMEE